MAAGSENFRCHQSVLHATTVEVEVIVKLMVHVMGMVAVTVSPVAVVVAFTVAVAAEVVSSVLPHPCKDRDAMKPTQMAANARANCMITTGSDAGTKNKCRSGLFTLKPKQPRPQIS
jgi:hypothetical protein